MTVNATEAVEITGRSSFLTPSSVTSSANSAGDAGTVTINTARLVIKNGGAVTSATLATGDAGSITINANESVKVTGIALGSSLPSFVSSSAVIVPEPVR